MRQTARAHQASVRKSKSLMRCSLEVLVLMRTSTSLPDGKWREVADAARAFEELGFDQAVAHEVQHDLFANSARGDPIDAQDRTNNLCCDCFSA